MTALKRGGSTTRRKLQLRLGAIAQNTPTRFVSLKIATVSEPAKNDYPAKQLRPLNGASAILKDSAAGSWLTAPVKKLRKLLSQAAQNLNCVRFATSFTSASFSITIMRPTNSAAGFATVATVSLG